MDCHIRNAQHKHPYICRPERYSIKINDSQPLVISPINKSTRSKSHIDYMEQMQRSENDLPIFWDDSRFNSTSASGGIFGFVKNNVCVEIHQIKRKMDSCNRLPSWSGNVGHQNRNVLQLSEKLMTIDWNKWVSLGGPKRVQGTANVVGSKEIIIDYIKSHFERN